jgi:hypothetical protein
MANGNIPVIPSALNLASALRGLYAFGGGGAKTVLRVRKRFFRNMLQVCRRCKRAGESSLLPDKTVRPNVLDNLLISLAGDLLLYLAPKIQRLGNHFERFFCPASSKTQ